jgi:nucleoid-associated protein EbfC
MSERVKESAVRPGGQPNLKQLMKLQQQLTSVQAELAEAEVTGSAGGGLVTVTMTAERIVRGVTIDPKAVDPDDVETLEDLVLAALHTATEAAQALHDEKMKPFQSLAGGLGLPGM